MEKTPGTRKYFRSEDSQTSNTDYENSTTLNKCHPLQVDTVLRCIFGFGELQTLKKCRLVCSKWKRICDPFFIQRSTFNFAEDEEKEREISELMLTDPANMASLFQSIEYEVRFTAMKLQLNLLTAPVLEKYFRPNINTLKQLKFCNSPCTYTGSRKYSNENRKFLSDLLTGTDLHCFKVQCGDSIEGENVHVSSKAVISIPYLKLSCCTFWFDSEEAMTPEELKLEYCKLKTTAGDNLGTVQIREYVNFRNLSKLKLICPTGNTIAVKLSDCGNIKYLSFWGTKIHLDGKISPKKLELVSNKYFLGDDPVAGSFILNNYFSTQCTCIDQLVLFDRQPCLDCTYPITIDTLTLNNVQVSDSEGPLRNALTGNTIIKELSLNASEIMTNSLPKSVERLVISSKYLDVDATTFRLEEKLDLPNLKFLRISDKKMEKISCFEDCHSLVDVVYNNCDTFHREDVKYAFNLPVSVERLVIPAHILLLSSGGKIKVLVLSVESCSWTAINFSICAAFTADIVLFCEYEFSSADLEVITVENVEIIVGFYNEGKMPKKFAFGPVFWNGLESFTNSKLSKLVDKMAMYYIIDGKTGKAIDETSFMEMIPSGH